MRDCKGQNIVEYVLLVAAIIAVCIIFLRPHAGGAAHDSINATLGSMATQIDHFTNSINLPH